MHNPIGCLSFHDVNLSLIYRSLSLIIIIIQYKPKPKLSIDIISSCRQHNIPCVSLLEDAIADARSNNVG